jgi:hypothetical protein
LSERVTPAAVALNWMPPAAVIEDAVGVPPVMFKPEALAVFTTSWELPPPRLTVPGSETTPVLEFTVKVIPDAGFTQPGAAGGRVYKTPPVTVKLPELTVLVLSKVKVPLICVPPVTVITGADSLASTPAGIIKEEKLPGTVSLAKLNEPPEALPFRSKIKAWLPRRLT